MRISGPHLPPVSVDQQQRGVVRGLTLLQLLNPLPQLVLHGLTLLQTLRQLLVLELQHLQVHLLLWGDNGGLWGSTWVGAAWLWVSMGSRCLWGMYGASMGP